MKASEIRELSAEERERKLNELTEALFNLRFQHEMGQLENPKRILQTRRDIARIRTVVRESSLSEMKKSRE
jgi:large subunit ribosomal protein L29